MMLSRLDKQQEISDKETFSLDGQLRQTVILLSPSWGEKHIDLNVNIPVLSYYGNPSLLSHLWINLLNNAIKFTPKMGQFLFPLARRKIASEFPYRTADAA